jgi:pyridoxine 4-dehydrogenase
VGECNRVLGGRKKVDVFECARVDPKTPIEETVKALGELVKEGKIGGIGLSEVRAETIRRAAKVHPIAAVEVELSIWATDILQNGVAKACAELGIPIVAYSPLCRGVLTGEAPKRNADVPEQLRSFPKFQDDVLQGNLRLTEEVEKLARQKGCTVAQVAIAWVRGMSGRNGLGVIVPIPGATTEARVLENSKDVTLTDEEMQEIDEILKRNKVVGERYGGPVAKLSEG